MERGESTIAASLLAGEVDKEASSPLHFISPASPDEEKAAPRRRRKQVQSLLEDQRQLEPHDGASTPSSAASAGRKGYWRSAVGLLSSSNELPDMFGYSASTGDEAASLDFNTATAVAAASTSPAVAMALQEAVLRWGASSSMAAVGKGSMLGPHVTGHEGDVAFASSKATPPLRHTWRLVDAVHRETPVSSSVPQPWGVGQRWMRVDSLARVDALARGVHQEVLLRERRYGVSPAAAEAPLGSGDDGKEEYPGETADGLSAQHTSGNVRKSDETYTQALRLCLESMRSTASLRSCLSIASLSPSALGTANASQLNAPSPTSRGAVVPSPLSFFTFTEAEYALLPPPPSGSSRFTFSSSSYMMELWSRFGNPILLRDRWCCGHDGGGGGGGGGVELAATAASTPSPPADAAAWVPSVEELCAEYHRVTTGVLRQRQQRLLDALQHPQPKPSESSEVSSAYRPRPCPSGAKASSAAGNAGGCDGSTAVPFASPRSLHPFVASFDRYALLHRMEGGGESEEEAAPLSHLGASPSAEADTAQQAPPDASFYPIPVAGATVTTQQRLAAYTTAAPWFMYTAEVQRRRRLAQLLQKEQRMNIGYQEAANRYLALAASAAQSLQRAAFAFADSDEDEDVYDSDGASKGGTARRRRVTRESFTVQLRSLPDVDPASWSVAEATVRKAAAEVMRQRCAASRDPGEALHSSQGGSRRSVRRSPKRPRFKQRGPTGSGNEMLDKKGEASPDSGLSSGSEDDASDDADEEGVPPMAARRKCEGTSSKSLPTAQRRRRGDRCGDASLSPPGHLPSDPSYAALQSHITTVLPHRCARLRGAVQAGWVLPPAPPLPRTLTDPLEEAAVCRVNTVTTAVALPVGEGESEQLRRVEGSKLTGAATAAAAADPSIPAELLAPIISETQYLQLRQVSTAAVCNRVVSHTGEAVLLSLPPTVPRLHREVEQELERYLYDDAAAMMEVTPAAQSLLWAIRVAYTQNFQLQRFLTRLEHVTENLRKVHDECQAEAQHGRGKCG